MGTVSNAALSWAFALHVTGPKKAVLVALAEHADDVGGCWPSLSRLVLYSGVCERATRNALRDLERDGLIRTEQSRGRTSSRYFLTLNGASGAGSETSLEVRPRDDGHSDPAPDAVNGTHSTRHDMPSNPAPDAPLPGISFRNPAPDAANPARGAPEPLEPSKNPQGSLIEGGPLTLEDDPVGAAVEIWNKICGTTCGRVQRITAARKTAVKARLREDLDNDLERWRGYCQQIAETPGLTGTNNRGWTADFDWAVTLGNMLKVLEGKYKRWGRPESAVEGVVERTVANPLGLSISKNRSDW